MKCQKKLKHTFFPKGHVKTKSACGSEQRSKHGLGLPILTKYWQIPVNPLPGVETNCLSDSWVPGLLLWKLLGSWLLHACCTCGQCLKTHTPWCPCMQLLCRYSDHASVDSTRSNHESKQSSKYISKKECEWKATHEAVNDADVLCLNELSGQTVSCHKQGSCITQNYATWNS